MTRKNPFAGFFIIFLIFLALTIGTVVYVDPYFHYHGPDPRFFYVLDSNERYLNDGIVKHFDYDALITGTSLTENFRTSEAQSLFGMRFIKLPSSGATYKETGDYLKIAGETHEVKMVIRSLEMHKFFDDKDELRTDLGEYPAYLYDDNLLNDGKYIFNRDIAFKSFSMIGNALMGKEGGCTDFDDYASWAGTDGYGLEYARDGREQKPAAEQVPLTEEDREKIRANLEQNVIDIAESHPETEYCCFFPPVSVLWWEQLYEDGNLYRQLEAEKYVIELLLPHRNIRLYSFNSDPDIIGNMDNYKDELHYGDWINSRILQCIKEEKYLLTEDNYLQYCLEEEKLLKEYPYDTLFEDTEQESGTEEQT